MSFARAHELHYACNSSLTPAVDRTQNRQQNTIEISRSPK